MKKYGVFVCVAIVLLWSMAYGEPALAEMGFGGRIGTSLSSTVDREGDVEAIWQEHLNLEFLLPDLEDTSAKFEFDLYYEPQGAGGNPVIRGEVTKLYVKQRFDSCQITLGRQPITWSFGSLVNPVDFTVNADLTQLGGQGTAENAALLYVPLGWASSLTVVAAFPEMGQGPKFAARGRTNLAGFDLTANYLREPAKVIDWNGMKLNLPASQRLAVTAKGDLGPVGVYGAVGYSFGEEFAEGNPVYVVGADYSFDLDSGSKLLVQAEYLHDEAGVIQQTVVGPGLLLGTVGYEVDEFSAVSLLLGFNPKDQSMVFAPVYTNQIGSGLDLTVSGAVFVGEETDQFGPKTVMSGVVIPRMLVQIGVGYPF